MLSLAAGSSLRGSTWLLAALATLALEIARLPEIRRPWLGLLATALTLAATTAVAAWFRRQVPANRQLSAVAILIVVGFVAAPFVAESGARWAGWGGISPEFVQLVALRNFMLGLIAVAAWPGVLPLSCALSLFLALGALALTTHWLGYGVALLYGLVGIWWLMGSSWERLEGRFACQTKREIPLAAGGGLAAIVLLGVAASVFAWGGTSSTHAIGGFFWGSGGDRWNDPAAARGVGDVDALVAAQDFAASFGAVESELFLDSDQPTLYDVFNDTFGEPLAKREQERTIGLVDQNTQESTSRTATTSEAGREFSTVRRRTQRRQQSLANRDAGALFYVAGRVPLHLRLSTFSKFDGRDWLPAPPTSSLAGRDLVLRMDNSAERPWLEIHRAGQSDSASEDELHTLRVMNLKTRRLPTPAHPTGVHIDKLDRADFFAWTADDVLEMPGRGRIPPLTVVHVRSQARAIAPGSGESAGGVPSGLSPQGAATTVEESSISAEVRALAAQWTAGVPRGWPQVAAICQRLRGGEFVVDREARAPTDCEDVAAHFLLESKRGPDYLFATSAATLLRALGYEARLATGFYAHPERFDLVSRQTKVLAADAHCWAEVDTVSGTWITVDPTPGYEVLLPRPTFAQAVLGALRSCVQAVARNWLPIVLVACLVVVVAILRARILDACYTLLWLVSLRGSPATRLLATVRLLERRARLAGLARPAHATLRSWYLPLAPNGGASCRGELEEFLGATAALLYGSPLPHALSAAPCRQVAARFTLTHLRATRQRSRLHSPEYSQR
ncbi:MAG: transglutaminase-like domain-containing protein [Pirellulaceae bacterium]|nr:transglutaminase-like domain-containing protein [Pirellulaceae bacterium]